MDKVYVNEIRRDREVSTVGLFYSRAEAENIVAQLRGNPDRADCHYEIIEAIDKQKILIGHRRRQRGLSQD